MKLDGRVALVTGASSGIGRAIALAFASEGASVVVADIREESQSGESEPTVEAITAAGGTAIFQRTDVTDDAAVEAAVSTAVDSFGGLDILVNAAGVTSNNPLHEVTDEEWDRVFAVNVTGIRRCITHAIPHLRESEYGRIINISSQRGLRGGGSPEKATYVASKGAVTNLTRQLALDYGPEGIAVNAICPGPVESGMTPVETAEQREELLDGILTPFVGTPDDIAPAAVLLASDDGRFIHGENLVIDGGYLVK